jgi:hypothetical protein
MHVGLGLYEFAEHRLRMFENRVPRKMFGSKEEEITEGWTNDNAHHDVYSSLNKDEN